MKQHASAHLVYDITHKGATNNYTTRTGEGFQQEVKQAYKQTNMKNVDTQVNTINISIYLSNIMVTFLRWYA